jgi:hypothetical protein
MPNAKTDQSKDFDGYASLGGHVTSAQSQLTAARGASCRAPAPVGRHHRTRDALCGRFFACDAYDGENFKVEASVDEYNVHVHVPVLYLSYF